jgi:hypothetical protein
VSCWIEENFADFLNKLGELRPLFNDKKADPTQDEAVVVATSAGPGKPPQYACTASLAISMSNPII